MKAVWLLLIALVVAASPAAPTPFRTRLPPRPRLPPPTPPLPPVPQSPPPPSGRSGVLGAPPPPTDCIMPLSQVFPCVDFLTNSSVMAPTARCCDGFRSVVSSSAMICLCHVMDRDIGNFTQSPPIDMFRVLLLPLQCAVVLPLRTFTMCSFEPIPPMRADNGTAAPPPPLDAISAAKVGQQQQKMKMAN